MKKRSKEQSRRYNASYYDKNRDRITAQKRKKYWDCEKSRKQKLAQQAKYHRQNPSKAAAKRSRRRALILALELDPETRRIEAALAAISTALRGIVDLHIDHIVPLSRGGAHFHENLRLLPASVNLQKHNQLDEELGSGLRKQVNRWKRVTDELLRIYFLQGMSRPKTEPPPKK